MINTYNKIFEVFPFDVDSLGRLKLFCLQNYMQTAAGIHADILGMSIDTLKSKSCALMMYRIATEVKRYPQNGEIISITTWPVKRNKIRYNRQTLIVDKAGEVIAKAETCWCILDLKTNKFVSNIDYIIEEPLRNDRIFEDDFSKLCPPNDANWEYSHSVDVRFGDIDSNGHVNNTLFTKWACDSLNSDFYLKNEITFIQLDFISQVFEGEQIEMHIVHGSPVYIKGVSKSKDKDVFVCKIEYRDKSVSK